MLNAALQTDRIGPEKEMPTLEKEMPRLEKEVARLAALAATGILDTEPEASYDAITRLSVEYFQADTALLGFADDSRVWIKSHSGQVVR